ncbi:MAG: hypothetical protein PHO37_07470 [Kiritimatiellae bacterium]|nr:hypothetical protein [Kiritimatiellia bacterium]
MKEFAYAGRLFAKDAPWGFHDLCLAHPSSFRNLASPASGATPGIAELCRTRAANPTHFNYNETWMSHEKRGSRKSFAMRATAGDKRMVRHAG